MEKLLRVLPPRPGSYALRYFLTAVTVLLCAALVHSLHGESGTYAFFVFYVAVFLTSILFDHNSGFFASALSSAFIYLWLKGPGGSLWPGESVGVLVAFVVISVGVAFVSEGLRKEWERAVEAERVKDLLLQELRHRTKNDLAMMISMLALQARSKVNEETRNALQGAISRLRAIAGAHDQFGTVDAQGRIDIKEYLTRLCAHFNDSLRDIRAVSVETAVDQMALPASEAQSIGLIVNELVTNAVKHAFPDERTGTIRVTLRAGAPRVLLVEDDGIGCGQVEQGGSGSRLTRLLVKQLNGVIAWEQASPGCRVRVTFAGGE